MVVVSLIAALTLAQAGVDVREPQRPYESAPPRAQMTSDNSGVGGSGTSDETAQPERDLGGANLSPAEEAGLPRRTMASEAGESQATNDANDSASGVGGAGPATTAKTDQPEQTDAQRENAALRQELQRMTALLQASQQEQAQTNAQLQSMQEQYTTQTQLEQAEKQQVLQNKQARLQALVNARQLLERIYPDSLHDSSSYAQILEQARFQIFRAGQLVPDSATSNAQEQLNIARGAFENDDLANTFTAVQQTIALINQAADQGGAAGGLPQY